MPRDTLEALAAAKDYLQLVVTAFSAVLRMFKRIDLVRRIYPFVLDAPLVWMK